MNIFASIGRYAQLMHRSLRFPQRPKLFFQQTMREMIDLGYNSLFIVFVSSVFIGAVMTMQTNNNIENPLLPRYTIGLVTRDTLLLEFCSTVMSLFLAGKIGSHIASTIGTMRINEQIDAMEVMGVNSANYIIAPKITAVVLYMPIIVTFSMFCGMIGGYLFCVISQIVPVEKYIYGIQYCFIEWYVYYALIKSLVFAFIIASVAAYHGYTVHGGALEVGRAATNSVVVSSVLILLFDIILTPLMI